MYLVDVYGILGDLDYGLQTIDRDEIITELDNFARIVSEVTEHFDVTEDDVPVGYDDVIRPNLEAIDIESLIRRHRE